MKFFNKYKLANHQDKNKIQLIPLKRKKCCKIPIEWDNIKPDLNSLLYKDLYTHSLKLEEENQRLLYEKKDLQNKFVNQELFMDSVNPAAEKLFINGLGQNHLKYDTKAVNEFLHLYFIMRPLVNNKNMVT